MRRWRALGLTREEALALWNDPAVGVPPPNAVPSSSQPVKILQASLGTGKSLIGERLHGLALDLFRRDKDAPIPVYLEARPPAGRLRAVLVEACHGLGDAAKRGVSVVVDDQTVTESASLLRVLSEATELAELWPQTTVVLLSRPLPDDRPRPETVLLPHLSAEETAALVNRLGGHVDHRLPHSLSEAITRPLFAILLAIATRRDATAIPRSTGELLRDLVRYALEGEASDPKEESPLRDALERLSVAVLTRGGPVPAVEVVSAAEVGPMVSSGLVVYERGTLRFSLDIVLEWFAAQALQTRKITPEQLVADERLVERWFYALTMFIAQAPHDEVTLFLGPLVRTYPTLTSEVVVEGLENPDHRGLFEEDETQPPPYAECGRRLAGNDAGLG